MLHWQQLTIQCPTTSVHLERLTVAWWGLITSDVKVLLLMTRGMNALLAENDLTTGMWWMVHDDQLSMVQTWAPKQPIHKKHTLPSPQACFFTRHLNFWHLLRHPGKEREPKCIKMRWFSAALPSQWWHKNQSCGLVGTWVTWIQ